MLISLYVPFIFRFPTQYSRRLFCADTSAEFMSVGLTPNNSVIFSRTLGDIDLLFS